MGYLMILRSLSLVATIVTLAVVPALADPPGDSKSTISLQGENDSSNPDSDKYYTNGLRIGYTSPTDALSGTLADLSRAMLGPGQQRFAIGLSQLIFTPRLTTAANPPTTDRPYAGLLLGTVGLITDTDATRTAFGLSLGVIGPAALGNQVQNGWHSLIHHYYVAGWRTQIPNQPVIQLTEDRSWRLPLVTMGALEIDAIPDLTVGAGTFRIYGQAGGQLRLGQGLRSDFGVPRIRPGLTGTDTYVQVRDHVSWYIFVGADGQAVAWDETLDGLAFARSRHVSREPLVGELEGGIALLIDGWRLTASQVLQTAEFQTQNAGLFQFTSISASFKF